jgi:hypothetical protein
VVNSKLDLISVPRDTHRHGHDPGVTDEDVEAVGLGQEAFCSSFDGPQGGKIALHEDEVDGWGDFADLLLHGGGTGC